MNRMNQKQLMQLSDSDLCLLACSGDSKMLCDGYTMAQRIALDRHPELLTDYSSLIATNAKGKHRINHQMLFGTGR